MDPSEHGRRLFNMGTTVNGNEAMEKPHTLEDYAIDHFRPPPKVGFILFYCEIYRIAHPKKIGKAKNLSN